MDVWTTVADPPTRVNWRRSGCRSIDSQPLPHGHVADLVGPPQRDVIVVRVVILGEHIASVRGGGHDAAENRGIIAKAEPPRAVEAVVDPPDGDIGQIAIAVTETE